MKSLKHFHATAPRCASPKIMPLQKTQRIPEWHTTEDRKVMKTVIDDMKNAHLN
jgi:hypothetical protein